MSRSNESGCTIQIAPATALLVVFVVLKLTNVINWSWTWVLAPAWAALALTLLFVVLGFIRGLTGGK